LLLGRQNEKMGQNLVAPGPEENKKETFDLDSPEYFVQAKAFP